MAGTIVISTNLKHLRYSVTRLAGADRTPIVQSEPLVYGKAIVRVDTDGLHQVTFIDTDHVYGVGQYFEQVTIAGDNVVTVEKNWHDADGNDLPVVNAPPAPEVPEAPDAPVDQVPDTPAPEPVAEDGIVDLIVRLLRAIARLFKRA